MLCQHKTIMLSGKKRRIWFSNDHRGILNYHLDTQKTSITRRKLSREENTVSTSLSNHTKDRWSHHWMVCWYLITEIASLSLRGPGRDWAPRKSRDQAEQGRIQAHRQTWRAGALHSTQYTVLTQTCCQPQCIWSWHESHSHWYSNLSTLDGRNRNHQQRNYAVKGFILNNNII